MIKELSRQNDAKAWWSVLSLLSVLAACIAAAVIWWTPWVIVPAILLIASRQQACFVLAHDAAHYRLFKGRGLNDFAGRLLATPAINDETDKARGTNRPAKDAILHDTTLALRLAVRRDRWLVVGFHLGAPMIAFATGHLWAYLILWILPLCTVLQAVLRFRAICEHGAVSDQHSPLLAAQTNLGPAGIRWYLFPYQVNYHIEHHLYPAIPHYNLPACHEELRRRGMLEGAEARHLLSTTRLVSADPAPEAMR